MHFALAAAFLGSLLARATASDTAGTTTKLNLLVRSYWSYGYEGGVTTGKPNGYAFGMGGMEKVAYDPLHKVLYAVSEAGFITLVDWKNGPTDAEQLPIVIPATNTYTDIQVCGDIMFAATKDDPNPGEVSIYKTAKRNDDGSVTAPEFVHSVAVGAGPDYILPKADCSLLAVANEGEGVYGDAGLINPEGSVSFVKGPFLEPDNTPEVSTITFPWSDEELLEKGVHMPLSKNAMEYWDDYSDIAGDIDFSAARASYKAADVLQPEWMVWSANEEYLLVNLQENSALIKINVADEIAEDIYSYGAKSWDSVPIDVIEDGGCAVMPTVEGLVSVRMPDSIVATIVDGETYIITANEGDDVEYGDFEEKKKSKKIFDGSTLPKNMTADPAIFDPASPFTGQSRYFNKDCEDEPSVEWCADSLRLTVGSTMVDYSDPIAPRIKSIAALGGRGVTIYKLTDSALELVWDSAEAFEVEGCAAYPWAHNGVQDEEFAAVGGALYLANVGIRETIEEMNDPEEDGCEDAGNGLIGACPLGQTVDERSLKDGPAAEAIVVGEACGKTYMVTVAEKNSIGFLYDISVITSPKLEQVFHLSPSSETKSPSVAYDDRTLGDIDPESILFLSAEDSPTGIPAVLFAGAWSTTTSFWDFECAGDGDKEDPPSTDPPTSSPPTSSPPDSSATVTSTGLLVGAAGAFVAFTLAY